jgi:hypothetical protein
LISTALLNTLLHTASFIPLPITYLGLASELCVCDTAFRLQAYRQVVDKLVQATGLPEDAILDIRGNHDSFDVPSRQAVT